MSNEQHPGRAEQARRYARIQRRIMLIELVLGFAYLIVVQFGGIAVWLRDRLPESPYVSAALFAVILFAVYTVATFPLSYYSGFVLPTRFGLNVQSLGGWLLDKAKGMLLAGVFGLAVLEALVWLLHVSPEFWWIGLAALLLLLTVVLANLAPVLIVPLFYKLTPLEDQELVRRLTALAERAGTKVRGVYVMNMSSKTHAGNAALMGLGNTRRIVVGDTMLKDYTPEEIEVVLAHELAHQVHGDIRKSIVVQTVSTVVGLWLASLALGWGVAALGLKGVTDVAALPLLVLTLSAYGLLTQPLNNGYSRRAERQADEYALETTRDNDSFISVMTKLHDQNLSDPDPPAWAAIWFYDHPPLRERLKLATRRLPT